MRPDHASGPDASLGSGAADRDIAWTSPRLKLVATLIYVVAVVALPVGWWKLVGAAGLILAFAAGRSGISAREIWRRWLAFCALFGLLAIMVALGHPDRPRLGIAAVALAIVAKNSLAFLAMVVLASSTPFPRLVEALRRLGAPPVFTATLHFMYRYIFVLIEERDRMLQARRARTFRRSWRYDWALRGGLIGVLFLRSLERGERVQAAMLARGWDGTVRTLNE